MDIIINCDGGRIGELWWFNSSTTPIRKFIPVFIGILDTGMVARQRVVQWGDFRNWPQRSYQLGAAE